MASPCPLSTARRPIISHSPVPTFLHCSSRALTWRLTSSTDTRLVHKSLLFLQIHSFASSYVDAWNFHIRPLSNKGRSLPQKKDWLVQAGRHRSGGLHGTAARKRGHCGLWSIHNQLSPFGPIVSFSLYAISRARIYHLKLHVQEPSSGHLLFSEIATCDFKCHASNVTFGSHFHNQRFHQDKTSPQ